MRDIELRGSNKKVSNRKVEGKDLLRYTAGHVVRQLLGIRVSNSPSKGFHLDRDKRIPFLGGILVT